MFAEVNRNTYVGVQTATLNGASAQHQIDSEPADRAWKKKKENRKKKRARTVQSKELNQIKSRGQRESASVGTGMTDLGGIGRTDGEQAYYIWRAIFTASTKGDTKSVSSHSPRPINKDSESPKRLTKA